MGKFVELHHLLTYAQLLKPFFLPVIFQLGLKLQDLQPKTHIPSMSVHTLQQDSK